MTLASWPAADNAIVNRGSTSLVWCYRIVRTDGQTHLFTTHDRPIRELRIQAFRPTPGITAFATQREAGLGERGTELRGLVGDATTNMISAADLRAGRLDGATVEEYVRDWQWPFWGYELVFNSYDLLTLETDGNAEWTMALVSPAGRLNRKIGEVASRRCHNQLGVNDQSARGFTFSACGVDVTAFTLPGTVSLVTDRRTFRVTGIQTTAAYYATGTVLFTSGNNLGFEAPIQDSTDAGGGLGVDITLMEPLPFDANVGDTGEYVAGDDKQRSTCISKFNGMQFFRGEPDIPGTDAALQSGNAV